MEKKEIEKLIDLKLRIQKLEDTDKEKKEVTESNPYAIREGWESSNMRMISSLEEEIREL